jgi:LPXTG-site transpeptidase (sortase) family protein
MIAVAAVAGCALLLFTYAPALRSLLERPPVPSAPAVTTRTVDATLAVEPTPTVVATEPPSPTYAAPVRLKIARLRIDAPVVQVGIDKDGVMESPSGPTKAGWYDLGPRPGERGSAVIAGHSGYRGGRAAIFDDLKKLAPGDPIIVVDKTGAVISFVVRESRLFDPAADTQEVFGRYDGRFLNLVTCTGAYSVSAGTHSKRLVVFADAVD